jgi:cytochrome c(L)
MGKKLISVGLLMVLILAAERSLAADEDPGKQLFMDTCQTCHRINGTGGDVGPDLSSVGARRDAEFIRQSILDPNAVVTEGYKPDIMPKNFKELFTEDQLNQLVTFLSNLKEPSKEAAGTSQDTKNPYTGNPQAIAEGQEIFLRLCAHCHGGNAEGGTCPDLTDDYWIFGGTDKVVYRTIVVGRKGTKMSGFWDSLKSDEVWKVIAYIRSKYKGSPEKIVW